MKKIALFLVLILVLSSAGCGANTTDFKTPDKISDYQYADFDKFNSPASENGLGGTQIYVDGIFEKIFEVEDYLYGRLKSGNNKWCVGLSNTSETSLSKLSFLEGKDVRLFGVYQGYAENFDMPLLLCVKFTLSDTGECYSILEFCSSISPIFEAGLSSAIEAGKELNPKDNITKSNNNSDDITVSKFIDKVETKSGMSLHCLDKTIVDDITAYIYIVNDDISIHIKENNKTNKITNVSMYFKIEIKQNLYSNVVQSFDTSVSNEDEAVDILAEMYDSMEDGISSGIYEKNGFMYTIQQLNDGTTCISISKV